MIQEETIKQLESLYDYCENMRSSDNDFAVWERDCEAIKIALSALRPVSRERVEQVWRGYLQYHGATGTDNLAVVKCSRCGAKIYEITVDLSERKFCLCCGAPLTDEAVEIVMERINEIMEEMKYEH